MDLWPTVADLAADLDFKYVTVAAWKQRNFIQPMYWPAIISAAQKRGIEGVTYETLTHAAQVSERKRRAG